MTDLTRDGSDTASAQAPDTLSSENPRSLRDSLVDRFGVAVGEAMLEIELTSRRKAAERLRGLQTQLVEVNAQIDSRLRENEKSLIPFTARMESSYAQWLADCAARDEKMMRDAGSLAELRNAAAELIKAINAPDVRFTGQVKQWSRPDWYQPPLVLPAMPVGPGGPR